MGWLIFGGIVLGLLLLGWLNSRLASLQERAKKYEETKAKLERLQNIEKRLQDIVQREANLDTVVRMNETKLKNEYYQKENVLLTEINKKEKTIREEIEQREEKLKTDFNKQKEELENRKHILQQNENAFDKIIDEKTKGFPWIIAACNDYLQFMDEQRAEHLQTKSHPAIKSAEELRQIAKERREAKKAALLSKYLLDYSRYLAPWLDDYIGLGSQELNDIIQNIHTSWEKKESEFDEDTKRHYGPKYDILTPEQKLQRKLEWYWEKPQKSPWQIGRDYERYIGYKYESQGWKVIYHGKEGFEDLGRDLICKKDNVVEIIQCKMWAQNKQIHEKHIYYLLGTTIEYYLDNLKEKGNIQLSLLPEIIQKREAVPKLISTIDISDRAKKAADVLGVIVEKTPFPATNPPYPCIKCNISRKSGEKIYHLPFDQQYDTTQIEEELECFVNTIEEAEAKGFRHAYRWKGETEK
jgi:hypothetical protein